MPPPAPQPKAINATRIGVGACVWEGELFLATYLGAWVGLCRGSGQHGATPDAKGRTSRTSYRPACPRRCGGTPPYCRGGAWGAFLAWAFLPPTLRKLP